jgi:hypothetical protein
MDAVRSKSLDFRLSQALAYPVVKKGVCGDFILCGLSPPVFAGSVAGARVYVLRRSPTERSHLTVPHDDHLSFVLPC